MANKKREDEQDSAGKKLLEQAYQLETPTDNVSYYNKLAESYDKDFADGLGYALPQIVAGRYQALCTDDDIPVADIGCGTGLIGIALNDKAIEIDGMDISPAMLKLASKTDFYRSVYEVDLSVRQSRFDANYAAVLSSGTFTHGHLGPDAFIRLLEMGCTNALFVIAINEKHFEDLGFDHALGELVNSNRIHAVERKQVSIYHQSDHAHGGDMALILSFRKT